MAEKSESLPGYQVLGKLGAGGMGIVFKALEIKTNRIVAIKMIFPKTVLNQNLFQSFRREAQLLIKFEHPNIIRGYYVTPPAGINGLHYLVMEYAEGDSVQNLIDQTQAQAKKITGLNDELALLIIMQAANAWTTCRRTISSTGTSSRTICCWTRKKAWSSYATWDLPNPLTNWLTSQTTKRVLLQARLPICRRNRPGASPLISAAISTRWALHYII